MAETTPLEGALPEQETRDFIREHRALLFKHARAYVRQNVEKTSVEDIAREMELMLASQLGAAGSKLTSIASADSYFRTLVRHAVGRARRRHTLIQDKKKVSFVSDTPGAERVGTKRDTAGKGGGNHGHEFGTALSMEEKDALVEYLKTL